MGQTHSIQPGHSAASATITPAALMPAPNMAETYSTSAPGSGATPPLAVFVHGGKDSVARVEWLEALQRAALKTQASEPSRLRLFSHATLEGAEHTDASLAQLGALCSEIRSKAPGHALLILRYPLNISSEALADLGALLARAPGPAAYTCLSNAHPSCNPWAGLPLGDTDRATRESLVALLGSGRLLPLEPWPDHLLALSPQAVDALADPVLHWPEAPARLRGRRVELELADWIYVESPQPPPDHEPALDPHEERRPQPWGSLAERLQAWLHELQKTSSAGAAKTPALPRPGSRPVTLHITHSWGGGIAAWIKSFIDADPDGLHLQLRAEGPQSRQGAGQRLSLYLGNELAVALDQWWLQPAIESVVSHQAQYREALDTLCERYGVGRIIVSSLVGHSLDALRTELPTVQVLHDPFPAWPLLSIHPAKYEYDLEAALQDRNAREQFRELAPEKWARVRELYAEAAARVHRVAPSRAAADLVARLVPQLPADETHVIPHGLPPLVTRARRQAPPARRQDGRLHLVIPGRMQSGKGADLLAAALPQLRELAHITLLGSGKGGERFFGQGGVNVVLEYERDELPGLIGTLAPDLALLPSTVPETFSYTLSEMWALGVPVLATRVGSFAERIVHGENGWLTDPDVESLVVAVRTLAAQRDSLKKVADALAQDTPDDPSLMVRQYAQLCPATLRRPQRPMASGASLALDDVQANARADQLRRARTALDAATGKQEQLRKTIEERTRWAQGEESQHRATRRTLMETTRRFESELAERADHIEKLDEQILTIGQQLQNQQEQSRQQQEQIRLMQNSHSWRLTKPLRVGRRLLASFVRLRAWNPLRWPMLLSQTVRNLSTVGLRGTLDRAQRFEARSAPRRQDDQALAVQEPGEAQLPQAVPDSDAPRVSVVIPAFNHLNHTAACLASIARVQDRTAVEVIVVDDASSDDTAEQLSALPGLHFIRNKENQGFIRSCNRGLATARGEFVLFLNNDTQVEDHWLERLLATFAERPDAGLVGARLIYPDGTLQECGGMVFADGSGWNYGRGDDPDKPEYQFLREVDYCSGACIMLRRELLETLGGFDELYMPAYYEDTDLAFKVRAAGLKVYVQPAVSIVHFEGVSSGTDLESGIKRYQVVNREKFQERWKDALAQQPAPIRDANDSATVRAARDHRQGGRVLLVDAYTPEPDQDSGSVRLVNLMDCLLEMGLGVTFVPDNRGWDGRYTRALQAMGVEACFDPWLDSTEAFLQQRGKDFDYIIISRHYIAGQYIAALRKYAPQAHFVFDTVDLHYLREERLAELEGSSALRQVARQTRRSELAVMRAADATLVVSSVEQELLARDCPEASVFILSNIHELAAQTAGFSERSDLYFVGGYQHPPNIDGASWFVKEVWPLVHERLPGVRFHLLGSKATDEVRRLGEAPGVEFHGFVERLEPFLDGCRLSVAPLRYGAGVKGKVNQAMAHGQPVVATPAAVEGIHAEHGKDALIADNAADFADAVVRLYEDEDLWQRLSANGLENVRAHFSLDAAKVDLQRLFDALIKSREVDGSQ